MDTIEIKDAGQPQKAATTPPAPTDSFASYMKIFVPIIGAFCFAGFLFLAPMHKEKKEVKNEIPASLQLHKEAIKEVPKKVQVQTSVVERKIRTEEEILTDYQHARGYRISSEVA